MNIWFRIGSLVLGCVLLGIYFKSNLLGTGIYFIVISLISEAW